jgi:hypothetical protein
MRSFNCFLALTVFPALLASAQDISGDWHGNLKAGAQELRILLEIAKSDNGEWTATMLRGHRRKRESPVSPGKKGRWGSKRAAR